MDTNVLYYGDNLEVLRKYIGSATIDLCYIDPPFNSKRTYNQIYNNIGVEDRAQSQAFIDTWTWDDRALEGYQEILDNNLGRFTKQIIEFFPSLGYTVLHERPPAVFSFWTTGLYCRVSRLFSTPANLRLTDNNVTASTRFHSKYPRHLISGV